MLEVPIPFRMKGRHMNDNQPYLKRIESWRQQILARQLGGSVSFGYPSFTASGTSGHSTIRHLSGWTARFGPSALAVRADGETLLVVPTGHDLIYARAAFPWIGSVESTPPPNVARVASHWLSRSGSSSHIGLTGYADVPYTVMTALMKDCTITNMDAFAAEERMIKDSSALSNHRRAAAHSDVMVEHFFSSLKSTEDLDGRRMMAEVEAAGRLEGAELSACWLAVGNEGRASYRIEEVEGRSYPPSEKALLGTYVTHSGYFAHCLRTGFRTDRGLHAEAHNVLGMAVEQQSRATAAIQAGKPARTVAEEALAWIDEQPKAQLGESCFRQAHFLGLDYAEYPTGHAFAQAPCWFSKNPGAGADLDATLESGMVMEVHTNFEHEDFGLIVMGDVFLVTEAGSERLTKAPQNPYGKENAVHV